MKNLTWQNPEQLFVAQELINKVKSKCCGIKDKTEFFIQAPNGPEQSLGEHKSPFICQLPLNDGTKIYLWSRGVGSENKALMTISK